MTEVARADAAWIKKALLAYSMGGEDRLDECLALGADPEVIAEARRARQEWEEAGAKIEARAAEITQTLDAVEPAQSQAAPRPAWAKRLDAIKDWDEYVDAGLAAIDADEATLEEAVEDIRRAWKNEENVKEFRERAEAFFISPDTQPSVSVEPSIEPSVETEPTAELQAQAERWPRPAFASETPVSNDPDNPAVLSVAGPYDNAKEYARRFCFAGGWLATYYWHERFWGWNGQVYEVLSTEDLRSAVYRFLDGSVRREGNKKGDGFQLVRFRPMPKDVNALVDGLRAGLALRVDCHPPIWLDSGAKAAEVLMFRNGLVDVMTGEKVEATPRLWMHSALEYDWNPEAQCPNWRRFLGEVFPGDQESQDCVEECLGYSMTEDLRFQKGVGLIGKARSGKGTIATKVLRKLVGAPAYVSLNFHSWTAGENSRQNLIGKKAGVFTDVRLKPPRWYGQSLDPGGMDHKSVELVLAITTGDPISVPRKYDPNWEGVLPVKLWFISNKVPNFNDPVLPTRFVMLAFGVSFLGREDVGLAARLDAEVEGIAARCLAAYRRLVRRGRFIQPKSALALERAIGESSDPFTQFVRETFVADYGGDVAISSAWIKFETWCEHNGRTDLQRSITKQNFRNKLREVDGFENVGRFRPHGEPRRLSGVRFKKREGREVGILE